MALTVGNSLGTTVSKIFYFLLVDPALCKGRKFLQFYKKIQSSMYKIFTQMNLTVEFNPDEFNSSHMESSTEFIKKFFF